MKVPSLLLAAALFGGTVALAAEHKPSAPAADARAAYPLTTCLVSDEALDPAGHVFKYTYKQAGRPDRTFLFCCEDCAKDFEKEPAKFVKKFDDAVAAKAKKGSSHQH